MLLDRDHRAAAPRCSRDRALVHRLDRVVVDHQALDARVARELVRRDQRVVDEDAAGDDRDVVSLAKHLRLADLERRLVVVMTGGLLAAEAEVRPGPASRPPRAWPSRLNVSHGTITVMFGIGRMIAIPRSPGGSRRRGRPRRRRGLPRSSRWFRSGTSSCGLAPTRGRDRTSRTTRRTAPCRLASPPPSRRGTALARRLRRTAPETPSSERLHARRLDEVRADCDHVRVAPPGLDEPFAESVAGRYLLDGGCVGVVDEVHPSPVRPF